MLFVYSERTKFHQYGKVKGLRAPRENTSILSGVSANGNDSQATTLLQRQGSRDIRRLDIGESGCDVSNVVSLHRRDPNNK